MSAYPALAVARGLTRQLRLRDETSARLAERHRMAEVLNQAADLIGRGWLQHGWFAYLDDTGQTHVVTAYNVHQMTGRPVAACLVGAVAQAGGGMPNIWTQAVQTRP
jgi:hypothetical protein